jgi:hypothetical protein
VANIHKVTSKDPVIPAKAGTQSFVAFEHTKYQVLALFGDTAVTMKF